MSDKCQHSSCVVEKQCTGFSVERCTWECGQDLIQLVMDNQFNLVATFTASELVTIVEEHKFMSEQIDKLNVVMPCGHLARYAANGEDGTQYCGCVKWIWRKKKIAHFWQNWKCSVNLYQK